MAKKVDETPQETPPVVETPAPQEKPVIEAPQIDAEAIATKIKDELTPQIEKTVKEKIVADLVGGRPDTRMAWERENRPPTQNELDTYLEQKLETRERAQAEAYQRQQQEIATQQQQSYNYMNNVWEQQLDTLRKAGKLPDVPEEIKTKMAQGQRLTQEEANHPGARAQRAIFEAAIAHQDDPNHNNLFAVHQLWYKDPGTQPPGADAPVSMGGGAQLSGDDTLIPYDLLHKTPIAKVIEQSMPKE